MENKKLKRIGKVIMVIVIVAIIIFICGHKEIIRNFRNLDSLLLYLRTQGTTATIMFISMFFLKPIMVIIPSAMMSITSGIMFGPLKGFIINMIGFFISGTIAFYISRILGKEFIDKLLKKKALDFKYKLDKNGFFILLLLRLPPILPFDPLSFACGLTNIKYKDFILASLIGVLPETLCYSIMGENILDPLSPKFILPVICVLISTALSGILFKKAKNMDS